MNDLTARLNHPPFADAHECRGRKASAWWQRFAGGLILLLLAIIPPDAVANEPDAVATNAFPTVPEVLGGATFENATEQDVYFLRAIHDRYQSHWEDLLTANITLNDYVLSPQKLLRFVNELGQAMSGRNDPAACTNLARIVCDPSFYASTNASHPEVLQAAAQALIKIGPAGRKALASAFTEEHYRTDPASLEVLADVIGDERPGDPEFVKNLAATAFIFNTTNGAFYPHCVTVAAKNLLYLTNGPSPVREHLKVDEVLGNPDVFQAVVEGIAAAKATELSTNLAVLQAGVQSKLAALAATPGPYRDELQKLEGQIERTLADFGKKSNNSQ
jgi:hypothetical protein